LPPITTDVNGIDVPTSANGGTDYAAAILTAISQLTEPVATLPASPSNGEIARLEIASGKYWHLLYNGTIWCPIGAQFPYRGQATSPSGPPSDGETVDLMTVPADGVYDIETTARITVAGGTGGITFVNRKRSGGVSTDIGEAISFGTGWLGYITIKALSVALVAAQTVRFGWDGGVGADFTVDHVHTTMWPVSLDA
jgi:hypothetical protein